MTNLPPAHNAEDPKCRCCRSVIEYNSEGYRFGVCTTCWDATQSFWLSRHNQLLRRGLIKK